MRVDECEVGGHLPSHQDWQKKKEKKKETPSAAASGGQWRRRRLGDGFLGAPGSCPPRPVGARAGAVRDPGRERGTPRGQYGRIPPRPGVRALGALRLRGGGGGERGSAGKSGSARPGAPRGAAPAGRGSRAAPRERKRKTEKEAKWSPFVLPAPHCWLLRAAGPHLPPPPLPRRARLAEVTAGRGPGAGAGRAGHFLCPAALPRAPLPPRQPSREPGPPASPAGAALFGWGEPKRKSLAGGAGEGAPRAAGTRRGAAIAGPPRSPLPPRAPRPRGSAFLSLPCALPSAPGQVGLRRARAGARQGLIQREAPRRG